MAQGTPATLLPAFKYHPDPLTSGSIKPSKKKCKCCARARGYIYTGPAYCEEELEEALCPWCIADGTAHEKFDATLVDEAIFPDDVPSDVVTEIAHRTPGYSAWQSEQWLSCCNDAMAFLEPIGVAELRAKYPKLEKHVLMYLVSELGLSQHEARTMLESLHRDKGPSAYVFQCLHCGRLKTYVDGILDIEA